MSHTVIYKTLEVNKAEIANAIAVAVDAIRQKGQDPVAQFAGYLVSGDPTYITSQNGARALFNSIDNFELARFIMEYFVENH